MEVAAHFSPAAAGAVSAAFDRMRIDPLLASYPPAWDGDTAPPSPQPRPFVLWCWESPNGELHCCALQHTGNETAVQRLCEIAATHTSSGKLAILQLDSPISEEQALAMKAAYDAEGDWSRCKWIGMRRWAERSERRAVVRVERVAASQPALVRDAGQEYTRTTSVDDIPRDRPTARHAAPHHRSRRISDALSRAGVLHTPLYAAVAECQRHYMRREM